MKKILLDTNFILIPAIFRVDIFSEINRILFSNYELCVLDKTIEELNNMVKREGRLKQNAKLALSIIKARKIRVITTHSQKYADQLILDTTNKSQYIVATLDMALKRKLKGKRIPIITMRQKKYLILAE